MISPGRWRCRVILSARLESSAWSPAYRSETMAHGSFVSVATVHLEESIALDIHPGIDPAAGRVQHLKAVAVPW